MKHLAHMVAMGHRSNSMWPTFKIKMFIYHSKDHPVILFNNMPVMKVHEHKHLGIILDSKLSFSAHIKSAISKTRKGIGLLKYLSKHLPRYTLNEIYKLYV